MSMRKDREITIIRESVTKSSRPVDRLSMSLVEALFDENYDVSSVESLNEERHKAPGYTKKDKKFLDQYSVVRDLAKSMKPSEDQKFPIDIPNVPDRKIRIVTNRNGIPRAYTDKSNYDEVRSWRLQNNNTDHDKPIIEITPDTEPEPEPETETETETEPSNDEKLKALLPEFKKIPTEDDLSYEQKLDKWLETYNKALDLSSFDDIDEHKLKVREFIGKLKSDKDNIFKGYLLQTDGFFLTGVRTLKQFLDTAAASDSLIEFVTAEKDKLKANAGAGEPPNQETGSNDEAPFPGDEYAPTNLEDKVADTMTYGDVPSGIMASPPEEGGDVIDGPPNGQGGGGNPPPPPTGDAKAVSDYIDQVATGEQTVDLSEIRRPLHKRSLVELLYSS